jgi:ATP-dependent DNA helicase HFM1/MER3
MFPVAQAPESALPQRSNTSKRRAEPAKPMRKRSNNSDDFGDDGIDDEELVKATCGDLEFEHIDNFANPTDAITRKKTVKNKSTTKAKGHANTVDVGTTEDDQEPLQLSNGKWACKHACKDKNACKHLCCKQGMDKPPKKPIATKHTVSHEDKLQPAPSSSQIPKVTQSKLQLTASKRKVSSAIEELDLTQDETRTKKTEYVKSGPRNYREPHQLHKTIQKKDPPSILHSVMHTKPTYCYSQGGEHTLSFLHKPRADTPGDWSDYGDVPFDELSSHFETPKPPVHRDTSMPNKDTDADTLMDYATHPPVASRRSDTFGDDDSLLGDVMIGLADSQTLQAMHDDSEDNTAYLAGEAPDIDFDVDFQDDDFATNIGFIADDHKDWPVLENAPTTSSVPTHNFATDNRLIPFYDITSSLNQPNDEIIPGKTRLTALPPQEHIPPKPVSPALRLDPNDAPILDDIELLDLLDTSENQSIEKKPVPEAFKELEPWLYQEFGDIVELVDG